MTCFPLGEVPRSGIGGGCGGLGPPSQPKLALRLPIKGPTFWSADRCQRPITETVRIENDTHVKAGRIGPKKVISILVTSAGPLWCLTAPPSPRFAVGLWALNNAPHMSLRESTERPILPPFRRSPVKRARGARRKAAYKTAAPAATATLSPKGCQT